MCRGWIPWCRKAGLSQPGLVTNQGAVLTAVIIIGSLGVNDWLLAAFMRPKRKEGLSSHESFPFYTIFSWQVSSSSLNKRQEYPPWVAPVRGLCVSTKQTHVQSGCGAIASSLLQTRRDAFWEMDLPHVNIPEVTPSRCHTHTMLIRRLQLHSWAMIYGMFVALQKDVRTYFQWLWLYIRHSRHDKGCLEIWDSRLTGCSSPCQYACVPQILHRKQKTGTALSFSLLFLKYHCNLDKHTPPANHGFNCTAWYVTANITCNSWSSWLSPYRAVMRHSLTLPRFITLRLTAVLCTDSGSCCQSSDCDGSSDEITGK